MQEHGELFMSLGGAALPGTSQPRDVLLPLAAAFVLLQGGEWDADTAEEPSEDRAGFVSPSASPGLPVLQDQCNLLLMLVSGSSVEKGGEKKPLPALNAQSPGESKSEQWGGTEGKPKSPVDGSRLSQPHTLIYKPRFALMAASWAVWPQIFWPCLSAPDLVSLDSVGSPRTCFTPKPVLEAGFLWNSLTQPNKALFSN